MKKFFLLLSLCAATASAQQVLNVEAELITTPAPGDVNPCDENVSLYRYTVIDLAEVGTSDLDEATAIIGEKLDELFEANPIEPVDAYWYDYYDQYIFEFNTELVDGGYKYFIVTYGEGADRLYRVGTRKLYVWDDDDTEAELNIDDEVHDFSEWFPAPVNDDPVTAIRTISTASKATTNAIINGQLTIQVGNRAYNVLGIEK